MATISVHCAGLPPLPAPESVAMFSAAPEGGEFRTPPPPLPPVPMSTSQPSPARPAAQATVPPPERYRPPEPPDPLDLSRLGPQDRALAELILRPQLAAQAAHRARVARMAASSWH